MRRLSLFVPLALAACAAGNVELDNIQPYILGFDEGYLSGANGMRLELRSLIPE